MTTKKKKSAPFFKELRKRWGMPSPEFFVKIQNFGYSLVGLGVALTAIFSAYKEGESYIVDFLRPWTIELVVSGLVIAAVAKATTVPKEPNPEIKKLQNSKDEEQPLL
jgi:hypothetical protein